VFENAGWRAEAPHTVERAFRAGEAFGEWECIAAACRLGDALGGVELAESHSYTPTASRKYYCRRPVNFSSVERSVI
jgi:hypothetical protein